MSVQSTTLLRLGQLMPIGVPWLISQRPALTSEDYLLSLMIDNPDIYYIAPGRQMAYFYLPYKGLVRMYADFENMTAEQSAEFITIVRSSLA